MYRVEIRLGSPSAPWQRTHWVYATREEAEKAGQEYVRMTTQTDTLTEKLQQFKNFPLEVFNASYRVIEES
jgi:hypothetical protein